MLQLMLTLLVYYLPEAKHSFGELWKHSTGETVFTRSTFITPPKVNGFI